MFRCMKTLLTTAAVAFIAATAAAQYKTPPTPAPAPATQNQGAIQVQPNNNIQITPGAVQDDLALARRIPRDEAIQMVKQHKAVWIDVRSKESYDESHIPGAISIPLSEMMSRLKELPPHKFLITYCA